MALVIVDHDRGTLDELSLQAVTFARGLAEQAGESLDALVVGEAGRDAASSLGAYGVQTVHLAVHPGLTDYAPAATARAAVQLAEQLGTKSVVAVGSDRGNEVIAHVGAILDLPVAADCLDVNLGDPTELHRARWGGNIVRPFCNGSDTGRSIHQGIHHGFSARYMLSPICSSFHGAALSFHLTKPLTKPCF